MSEHDCMYITNITGPHEYCGRPASIKREGGSWYCAEHYDILMTPYDPFIDSGIS